MTSIKRLKQHIKINIILKVSKSQKYTYNIFNF